MSYLKKKSKKRWMLQNKENKQREGSVDMFEVGKNTPFYQKLKTQPNEDARRDQFRQALFTPSCQMSKNHRPFLENKKIVFNARGIKNKQQSITFERKKQKDGEETNIDKLKREIQDLDKDDFISYRSRTNSYMDDIKVVQNARISKYNHENSLIVELKGQTCLYKPLLNRPRTTISISGKASRNCTNYSMPHKYFSKPKKKANQEASSQKAEVLGEAIINTTKLKMKPEQLFIGLNNMLRGHMKHKKNNSQFCFI